MPGKARKGVMHGVEVVVEIEEAAEEPALDNHGAALLLRRWLVLHEGAEQRQRKPGPGELRDEHR